MLIVTVALKSELPWEWLKLQHIAIITKNNASTAPALNRHIIFITGVGSKNAHESAKWIVNNLRPAFILNLGSAGSFKQQLEIGNLVLPSQISNTKDENIQNKLPFLLSKNIYIHTQTHLLSIDSPVNHYDKKYTPYDLVDMEAYEQAIVCSQAKIPFCTIKCITDYILPTKNHSKESQFDNYTKALKPLRVVFTNVLAEILNIEW